MFLLDEADGLTKQAQEALRRMMETGNALFILTANNENAIIPALKSRCYHLGSLLTLIFRWGNSSQE